MGSPCLTSPSSSEEPCSFIHEAGAQGSTDHRTPVLLCLGERQSCFSRSCWGTQFLCSWEAEII